MLTTLKRLWKEEDAVSATEYGIIAALIAVALIATLYAFREKLTSMFNAAGDAVEDNTAAGTSGT